MQKSNATAEYILIRAYTTSEWDNCSFAIIHVSEEWRNMLQQRLLRLQPFQDDLNFWSHSYWESPEGFYVDSERCSEILKDEEDWAYVQLDTGELETFITPENVLDLFALEIDRYGGGLYRAYGKHSGEEFYTAEFILKNVINAR